MSSEKSAFSVDLGALRSRSKDSSAQAVGRVDTAGEKHGFVDREPKRKGGKKPSPRTAQVHAWVLPDVADEIASEQRRSGKTQGVLIEEAWALYRAQRS